MEPRTISEMTLIKIPEADSLSCKHLYGSLIQEIQRLEFCNLQGSVVGFSLKTLLGDLDLYEVKRDFMLDAGSDSLVVILSSTTSINKAI